MEVLKLSEIQENKECAIAIGNFDGVHRGHKYLLEELKNKALQKNIETAILCFEPQPKEFFFKINDNFRISKLEDKILLLNNFKINKLIIADFNNNFSKQSAEYFLEDILLNKLNSKIIITGKNFIFGAKRKGSSELIREYENNNKFNFKYYDINIQNYDNKNKISSTKIRELINLGKIKKSNKLLGYNFFIQGKVIEGLKKGSGIGFPTANINIDGYIKPKFGVYKTTTEIDERIYNSITNFGVKPTITNENKPILETHILNFGDNIYGKKIKINFLQFIRDEEKFNSLEELKAQIKKDILKVKNEIN